jgi:hypothetical protein
VTTRSSSLAYSPASAAARPGVVVSHLDREDSALAVHEKIGALAEIFARILHPPVGIDASQIELVDQVVLNRAALQDADEKVGRTFEAQQISRHGTKARSKLRAEVAAGRGQHGRAHSGAALIRGHQARRGRKSLRNHEGQQHRKRNPRRHSPENEAAIFPDEPLHGHAARAAEFVFAPLVGEGFDLRLREHDVFAKRRFPGPRMRDLAHECTARPGAGMGRNGFIYRPHRRGVN